MESASPTATSTGLHYSDVSATYELRSFGGAPGVVHADGTVIGDTAELAVLPPRRVRAPPQPLPEMFGVPEHAVDDTEGPPSPPRSQQHVPAAASSRTSSQRRSLTEDTVSKSMSLPGQVHSYTGDGDTPESSRGGPHRRPLTVDAMRTWTPGGSVRGVADGLPASPREFAFAPEEERDPHLLQARLRLFAMRMSYICDPKFCDASIFVGEDIPLPGVTKSVRGRSHTFKGATGSDTSTGPMVSRTRLPSKSQSYGSHLGSVNLSGLESQVSMRDSIDPTGPLFEEEAESSDDGEDPDMIDISGEDTFLAIRSTLVRKVNGASSLIAAHDKMLDSLGAELENDLEELLLDPAPLLTRAQELTYDLRELLLRNRFSSATKTWFELDELIELLRLSIEMHELDGEEPPVDAAVLERTKTAVNAWEFINPSLFEKIPRRGRLTTKLTVKSAHRSRTSSLRRASSNASPLPRRQSSHSLQPSVKQQQQEAQGQSSQPTPAHHAWMQPAPSTTTRDEPSSPPASAFDAQANGESERDSFLNGGAESSSESDAGGSGDEQLTFSPSGTGQTAAHGRGWDPSLGQGIKSMPTPPSSGRTQLPKPGGMRRINDAAGLGLKLRRRTSSLARQQQVRTAEVLMDPDDEDDGDDDGDADSVDTQGNFEAHTKQHQRTRSVMVRARVAEQPVAPHVTRPGRTKDSGKVRVGDPQALRAQRESGRGHTAHELHKLQEVAVDYLCDTIGADQNGQIELTSDVMSRMALSSRLLLGVFLLRKLGREMRRRVDTTKVLHSGPYSLLAAVSRENKMLSHRFGELQHETETLNVRSLRQGTDYMSVLIGGTDDPTGLYVQLLARMLPPSVLWYQFRRCRRLALARIRPPTQSSQAQALWDFESEMTLLQHLLRVIKYTVQVDLPLIVAYMHKRPDWHHVLDDLYLNRFQQLMVRASQLHKSSPYLTLDFNLVMRFRTICIRLSTFMLRHLKAVLDDDGGRDPGTVNEKPAPRSALSLSDESLVHILTMPGRILSSTMDLPDLISASVIDAFSGLRLRDPMHIVRAPFHQIGSTANAALGQVLGLLPDEQVVVGRNKLASLILPNLPAHELPPTLITLVAEFCDRLQPPLQVVMTPGMRGMRSLFVAALRTAVTSLMDDVRKLSVVQHDHEDTYEQPVVNLYAAVSSVVYLKGTLVAMEQVLNTPVLDKASLDAYLSAFPSRLAEELGTPGPDADGAEATRASPADLLPDSGLMVMSDEDRVAFVAMHELLDDFVRISVAEIVRLASDACRGTLFVGFHGVGVAAWSHRRDVETVVQDVSPAILAWNLYLKGFESDLLRHLPLTIACHCLAEVLLTTTSALMQHFLHVQPARHRQTQYTVDILFSIRAARSFLTHLRRLSKRTRSDEFPAFRSASPMNLVLKGIDAITVKLVALYFSVSAPMPMVMAALREWWTPLDERDGFTDATGIPARPEVVRGLFSADPAPPMPSQDLTPVGDLGSSVPTLSMPVADHVMVASPVNSPAANSAPSPVMPCASLDAQLRRMIPEVWCPSRFHDNREFAPQLEFVFSGDRRWPVHGLVERFLEISEGIQSQSAEWQTILTHMQFTVLSGHEFEAFVLKRSELYRGDFPPLPPLQARAARALKRAILAFAKSLSERTPSGL